MRQRFRLAIGRRLATALALVPIAALASHPAGAQSLLQGLFGSFLAPSQPPPAVRVIPPRAPVLVSPAWAPAGPAPSAGAPSQSRGGGTKAGGGHRTVCVRLCDGYYWPISHDVGPSQFSRDARACRASCGEEVRLFTAAASDPGAESLLDQSGRAYTRLPNAFRHRKERVPGCHCKPAPWSAAELARHREYALAEASARREAAPPVTAAAMAPAPTKLAQAVVAQAASDVLAATSRSPAPAAGPATPEPKVAAVAPPLDEALDGTQSPGAPPAPATAPAAERRPAKAATPASARRPPAISPAPVARQALPPPPVKARPFGRPASAPVVTSGLVPTAGKYSWPGDAPRRYR